MKKLILTIALLGLTNHLTQAQKLETVEAKYRGKPIIEMTINNQKTWVLLDTGSEYTVLDSGMKEKYDYFVSHASDNRLSVSGLGSANNQLMEVSNAEIKFGHVKLKGATYAFDLTTVAQSIQLRTGKRISAIIGTHMMRNYGFVIDMRQGTATLHTRPKRKRMSANEIVIAKSNHSNH